MKNKKNEPRKQSSIKRKSKDPFLSYEQDGEKINIYEQDLLDELMEIKLSVNQKQLAETIAWTINTIGQLENDQADLSQDRRIEQIMQFKNSLRLLQDFTFNTFLKTNENKAVLKVITKEEDSDIHQDYASASYVIVSIQIASY